eukprot:131542-Hanusia_phi.AAC.1
MNETNTCIPRKESQSCANAGVNGGTPNTYYRIYSQGDYIQPRGFHSTISFKGQLYLIGGAITNDGQPRYLNQSFSDGTVLLI